MRKLTSLTLTAALLIIALNSVVFTQTQPSSTVSRDETVAFLLEQNKSANDLIAEQKSRIKDLEAEVETEKENSASVGKSYESAKTEIASLKSSNEALSRAVALNESTIALLQQDNAKQRDKAKKATKDKYKAYAVTVGVILLKFLIP